jgi:hypothetical protein
MPHARFPDFLGIGAQKSGTTWLHANLRAHPEIWMPPLKELHYFDQVNLPDQVALSQRYRAERAQTKLRQHVEWATGAGRPLDLRLVRQIAELGEPEVDDAWYGRIFAAADPAQLCGEITPEYGLLHRGGIAHVRRVNPNMRIILLLRDPLERCWSHLRMLRRMKATTDMAHAASLPNVTARSDYPFMIRAWRTAFGEDGVFVECFDRIEAAPLEVLGRVCAFLGVRFDPALFPKAADKVHVGDPEHMPPAIRETLLGRLRPIYEEIARTMPEPGERWMAAHY